MKHASAPTLERLSGLLDRLRAAEGLVERKPGTFYLRSSAFLHFHEDPAGLFADVKLEPGGFTRVALNTQADEAKLIAAVAHAVSQASHTKRVKR